MVITLTTIMMMIVEIVIKLLAMTVLNINDVDSNNDHCCADVCGWHSDMPVSVIISFQSISQHSYMSNGFCESVTCQYTSLLTCPAF